MTLRLERNKKWFLVWLCSLLCLEKFFRSLQYKSVELDFVRMKLIFLNYFFSVKPPKIPFFPCSSLFNFGKKSFPTFS